MDLVMKETLGNDWLLLFDRCIFDTRQPLFQIAEQPFFQVKRETEVICNKITDVEGMLAMSGNICLQGSGKLLT
jgi:hypothetical protein